MSVRDKNDKEWQDVRQFVYTRDNNRCRLCSILTYKEKLIFDKTHPSQWHLDPAHVFPVSTYPSQVYNRNNVYSLCRTHHERIDNYCSPVTGKQISINRHFWWWYRVINKSTIEYDMDTNYEGLVKDQILE
jgi:hypothetical protein